MQIVDKLIKSLVLAMLSTGCSTNTVVIHRDIHIKDPCIFEKFTEAEKNSMIEPVGKKIYRNQENCRIIHKENSNNAKAHNEAHQ